MLPKLILSPTLNFYIVLNVAYHMNHVKIKCIGKCDGEQGAFISMPETWETTTPKNSKTNKQMTTFPTGYVPSPTLNSKHISNNKNNEQVEGKETTWWLRWLRRLMEVLEQMAVNFELRTGSAIQ